MKVRCGTCDKVLEVDKRYFTGGAFKFWEVHGHFPSVVWYECPCGENFPAGHKVSGCSEEDVQMAARMQAFKALLWFEEHQPHSSMGKSRPS